MLEMRTMNFLRVEGEENEKEESVCLLSDSSFSFSSPSTLKKIIVLISSIHFQVYSQPIALS